LRDDTVILYISDHGNHFKTRNAEYKRSCHESSIHVPCFATGPGFRGGGTVTELFSLVDIPPTLLDAAGIEIPDGMEGRSAVDLLRAGHGAGTTRAEACGWPDHVFVQISEAETGRAVRTHRWKYGVRAYSNGSNGELPIEEFAEEYTEAFLYDLEHDPYELENIVALASHEPVRVRLRSLLLERIQSVEGRSPRIITADSVPAGQRMVATEEVSR
jgi:arylsulfatase A-like enzyme